MRAVPLAGTFLSSADLLILCGGPPRTLRLRFPVGARIEVEKINDGWVRGTVVSYWWRNLQFGAGEYAAYQLKMDLSEDLQMEEALMYVATDNDEHIRAAAPASPRRLVRRLRSPADAGDDWRVGRLQVQRVAKGSGEDVEGISNCTEEEGTEMGWEDGEETRCANCGKRSAKNRACRGRAGAVYELNS
jgi:hypothetical protein